MQIQEAQQEFLIFLTLYPWIDWLSTTIYNIPKKLAAVHRGNITWQGVNDNDMCCLLNGINLCKHNAFTSWLAEGAKPENRKRAPLNSKKRCTWTGITDRGCSCSRGC